MILKKILNRTNQLAVELTHFKRLGQMARRRSFLNREIKKNLLKLGEKAHQLIQEGKIQSKELSRLEGQIEKLERLLEECDYGAGGGVDFKSPKSSPPSKG